MTTYNALSCARRLNGRFIRPQPARQPYFLYLSFCKSFLCFANRIRWCQKVPFSPCRIGPCAFLFCSDPSGCEYDRQPSHLLWQMQTATAIEDLQMSSKFLAILWSGAFLAVQIRPWLGKKSLELFLRTSLGSVTVLLGLFSL